MITKPTVLILGAGASLEYGFPLGIGLRNKVCALTVTSMEAEVIDRAGYSLTELNEFVDSLRFSAYTSVDWFLEKNSEFIDIGKAAIAASLIPLEIPDRLFPPSAPAQAQHWYELLFNVLDTPIGSFLENIRNLSVITFNYDRSLEYYLLKTLSSPSRSGSQNHAIKIMHQFELVHVHGALGNLIPFCDAGRSYEPSLEPKNIRIAAEQLIIVGEASGETDEFNRARELLSRAERIIFLGFGYHPESISRLGIFNEHWDDNKRQQVRVSGTSQGIRLRDWQNIQSHILNGAFPPEARSQHDVCSHLYEVDQLDD